MKNELISTLKNQLVVALVVAGTITIAIPIFVCGLISTLLEFPLSLAASKALAVAEKLENRRNRPQKMEHCNAISVEMTDMRQRTLRQQRTLVFEGPSADEDCSEIPKVICVTRITSGALMKSYIAR